MGERDGEKSRNGTVASRSTVGLSRSMVWSFATVAAMRHGLSGNFPRDREKKSTYSPYHRHPYPKQRESWAS